MGNRDKLRRAAHLLHHIGKPQLIRFVKRRVHLVEQAERRRIQAEHGKNERCRGKRLFTA